MSACAAPYPAHENSGGEQAVEEESPTPTLQAESGTILSCELPADVTSELSGMPDVHLLGYTTPRSRDSDNILPPPAWFRSHFSWRCPP